MNLEIIATLAARQTYISCMVVVIVGSTLLGLVFLIPLIRWARLMISTCGVALLFSLGLAGIIITSL